MADTGIAPVTRNRSAASSGSAGGWSVGPVAARPYAWPYDRWVDTGHLAVVCIDWQVDFCGFGGYVDRMGYDVGLTRAGLPGTARLLEACPGDRYDGDPHPRGSCARPG